MKKDNSRSFCCDSPPTGMNDAQQEKQQQQQGKRKSSLFVDTSSFSRWTRAPRVTLKLNWIPRSFRPSLPPTAFRVCWHLILSIPLYTLLSRVCYYSSPASKSDTQTKRLKRREIIWKCKQRRRGEKVTGFYSNRVKRGRNRKKIAFLFQNNDRTIVRQRGLYDNGVI